MDPSQAPQSPPSFVPPPKEHNPYDFLQPAGNPKKPLLPQSLSKQQRLLVVIAGVVVLLFIIALVIGFLGSLNSGPKDTFLSLEQQQAELIRVADLGSKSANQPEAKALAITVKYSIMSQQTTVQSLAKKAGAPSDAKSLSAGKNSKTDATLTTATQTNQFDQVFIAIMKNSLTTYRKTLDQARVGTSGAKSQASLKAYEDQVSILIADDKSTPLSAN